MVNVSHLRALTVVSLLAALAACADQPTEPSAGPEQPKPAPVPLGLYQVTLTGLNGDDTGSLISSKVVAVNPTGGASAAMSAVNTGITIELVTSSVFSEGTRPLVGQPPNGQRFISATYRLKNTTGGPLTNLTIIPVTTANTVPGTPFTSLLLFNNAPASNAIAQSMVPTGAVFVGEDGRMRSRYPDVLQVFTEAEVAAITPPADVTGLFPYGFVVSNPSTPNSRTIPNAVNGNDFGGMVTFGFRYPMQTTAAADPYFASFWVLVVQDTETRMTESIEERQDTAGVRRARERATALGATTVTVLAGSPATDPFVTDYPGQRQICSVRTAGSAASPLTFITNPGAFTEMEMYKPSETVDPCAAYFTAGTPPPANYGMPYTVTTRAMDRYGNTKTMIADSVSLTSTDGTAVMPPGAPMVNGVRARNVTYTTYGNSTLTATGRRLKGSYPMFVNGMTRTWGGATSTQWLIGTNWTNGMYPGAQDSVIIPADLPNYPLLVQNTAVPNIIMQDGATTQPFVNLSSFDFTITGNLEMGNNGTFQGTGRVILAGTGATFGGGLSNVNMRNLRITGTYSATSNANVTGGRIVVQGGRLRSSGYRIRVRPS